MAGNVTAVLKQAIRAARADDPAASDRELLRRFARDGDQAAFGAVVARHAGMVLGACRRALPTVQDAEDACQTTFLVLANKAKGGRWQPSVANWLYATARKVAHNARVAAERRARREAGAAVPEAVEPVDRMTGRELLAALDDALEGLPDLYREPLVLCYLEGLTRDQAAARLGVPLATLRTRLDRGRKRLHEALTRVGCALGAGLLALTVTSPAGASPPRLVESILAAASGSPSASVGELAKGVAVNGALKKAILAIVPAVGLAALGVGLGSLGSSVAGQPAGTAAPAAEADDGPRAAAPAGEPAETVRYSGRVLGPDGKPVAGARLYETPQMGYLHEPYSTPERATSGPDGRFEVTVPRTREHDYGMVVVAAATGYGVGWVYVRSDGKRDDLTVQLVKDDVPITGQIVDLEGKPVPGVTLRVQQINAAPGEDIGPWLDAVRAKKWPDRSPSLRLQQQHLPRYTISLSPTVTTDAQGRFRLTGMGRDRLVTARLDGPTVVSQHLHILTRAGERIEVPEYVGKPEYGEPSTVTTYFGADFKHAAAPCRPITGVVRDKDTNKPLAGVTVRSHAQAIGPSSFRTLYPVVRTTTDAEGRYRLTGMPRGEGYTVAVIPARDQPYVFTSTPVPDGPGLDPVTLDVGLMRGVWIEGRLTDKVTGKPVKGSVEYFSMYSNPNRPDYPGYEGAWLGGLVGAMEDGSFRVVGLPGPGLVAVYCHEDYYLRADQRDDEFGTKEKSLETAPYHISFTSNYWALARIDPAKGVESVKRDVTLDPGWSFTGTVLGPDGKPLAGARSFDLHGHRWGREGMKTAEFAAWFDPRRPRDILFRFPEKGLVGVAQPPKENGGSVAVRMGPGAAVTGHLVGPDGKPRAGVELRVQFLPKGWGSWYDYYPEPVKSDRDGRFRVEGLLPGQVFRLSDDTGELPLGDGLRPGETTDLGAITTKPPAQE
jgi:RNA polymerase sigma factor (sigma-70 family)